MLSRDGEKMQALSKVNKDHEELFSPLVQGLKKQGKSPSSLQSASYPTRINHSPSLHHGDPSSTGNHNHPLDDRLSLAEPLMSLDAVVIPHRSVKDLLGRRVKSFITGLVYDERLTYHQQLLWESPEEREGYLEQSLYPGPITTIDTETTAGNGGEEEVEDGRSETPQAATPVIGDPSLPIPHTHHHGHAQDDDDEMDSNYSSSEETEEDLDEDDDHPESPMRIVYIYQALMKGGTLFRCSRIPIIRLSVPQMLTGHSPGYITRLLSTSHMNKYELKTTEARFNSVYLCGQSAECSRLSAGGVYAACAAVLRGDVRNAFAIVRPP